MKNTVEVTTVNNNVLVRLVAMETIQYGLMGLQAYEGVEPIDDSKEG